MKDTHEMVSWGGFLLGLGLLGASALGCSWFQSPLGQTVVGTGIDLIVGLVKKETGHEFDNLPTKCETENDKANGKLLLLCTVCYGPQEGPCQ